MSEGKFDMAMQKAANWVAGKLAPGGFPTVPDTGEQLYPEPSPEDPKPEFVESKPESKGSLFHNLKMILSENGKLPEPGYGINFCFLASPQTLFGNEINRGVSGRAFIDIKDHTFSKLWEMLPDEKWAKQNESQKELYKRLNNIHPWFTFVREFPGGWSQKEIPNRGNLEDFLKNGGKISSSQIEKAVNLLNQAHILAQEAHGDLTKNKRHLHSREVLLESQLRSLEPFGYLNTKNILVAEDGSLQPIDYAGNPDPMVTADIGAPERKDPKSPAFMRHELEDFRAGLNQILSNQKVNPFFYVQLFLPVDKQSQFASVE